MDPPHWSPSMVLGFVAGVWLLGVKTTFPSLPWTPLDPVLANETCMKVIKQTVHRLFFPMANIWRWQ